MEAHQSKKLFCTKLHASIPYYMYTCIQYILDFHNSKYMQPESISFYVLNLWSQWSIAGKDAMQQVSGIRIIALDKTKTALLTYI